MRANNLTLLTDLYELTMMQGYFKNPTNQTVIFDMFYRTNPCGGAFAITAGLEQMIEYIENLKFTDEDIEYLRSLNIFEEDFLEYLSNFRFTGDIYAIVKKLTEEYDELEQAHETTYGEFKTVRDDLHRLWKVKSCVDTATRFNERAEEQKLQNRPQTRHKKEELSR